MTVETDAEMEADDEVGALTITTLELALGLRRCSIFLSFWRGCFIVQRLRDGAGDRQSVLCGAVLKGIGQDGLGLRRYEKGGGWVGR